MANPITCFVAPKSDLDIVISKKPNPDKVDPVDFNGVLEYRIAPKHQDLRFEGCNDFPDDDDAYTHGLITPLSKISLPPNAKEKAGIPHDARYYGYIHPPSKMCDHFENFDFSQGANNFLTSERNAHEEVSSRRRNSMFASVFRRQRETPIPHDEVSNRRQNSMVASLLKQQEPSIPREQPRSKDPPSILNEEKQRIERRRFCTALFSVCGAFIYFDASMRTVSINVISLMNLITESARLSFSGPFNMDGPEIERMLALGRIQPLKPRSIHESGYVGYGWQRHSESFKTKKGKNIDQGPNHGAFVFYRNDGTGVRYRVTLNREDSYEYPRGDFDSSLADAFGTVRRPEKNEKRFVSADLRHHDLRDCKRRVQAFIGKEEIENINCRSLCSDTKKEDDDEYPIFHQALKCKRERAELELIGKNYHLRCDKFGWNPLHYCCRFYADNLDVLNYLVTEKFTDKEQLKALNVPDKYHRYPLHIACDSHASTEVVKLLLALPIDIAVLNGLDVCDPKECKRRVDEFLHGSSPGIHNSDGDSNDNDEIDNEEEQEHEEHENEEHENFPLFHQALRCRSKLMELKQIGKQYGVTEESREVINDKFGWNPLHYGCRFYANDLEVMKYLIEEKFNSIEQLNVPDKFNLYPIDIARDNNASEEVKNLLLRTFPDHKPVQGIKSFVLAQKTKHLELLPLHVACNRGASIGVIKALLDQDKIMGTIKKKTRAKRLPLHLAIGSRMHHDVIKLLIDAEKDYDVHIMLKSEKFNTSVVNNIMNGKYISKTHAINQYYDGLLPLHMACLNGFETRTIKLLVKDSDPNDQKIFTKLDEGEGEGEGEGEVEGEEELSKLFKLPKRFKFLTGMRALHLCLFQENDLFLEENVRFLLEQEQRYNNSIGVLKDGEKRKARALDVDIDERTCLHLACKRNVSIDIIKRILALDPYKDAIRATDRNGSTPLHLACHHRDSREDIIQVLLKVETLTDEKTDTKSQPFDKPEELLDNLGRSPFCLAVKSKAPTNVLKIFLKREYFNISGFEDREINELARRIKTDIELQRAINSILCQRLPFGVFWLYLLINFGVLTLFLLGCEAYLDDKELSSHVFNTCYLLCLIGWFWREVLQLWSEGWNYFVDLQSYSEWISICLLSTSLTIFNNLVTLKSKSSDLILAFTTFFLIINVIFFLRNFSLSFAQFAGGLVVILKTVIPFFLVSLLMLFIFSHSLRLTLRKSKETFAEDTLKGMCAMGNQTNASGDEMTSCFMAVLNSFFGGGINVETRDALDIAFGAIILLVLVNVNIAIVSDAWGDAKDHAIDMYWRGRLSFLGEISRLMRTLRRDMEKPNWLEQIDEVRGIDFKGPECSWSQDYPYNSVWNKDEYEHPEKYFPPKIALTIKEARSVQSDMYWFKREKKNDSFCRLPIHIFFYWFWRGMKHFGLIILGSITFGFFIPEDVRLWLLSSVDESSDAKSEEQAAKQYVTSVEKMQNEMTSMKEIFETHEKKYEELKNLLTQSLNSKPTEGETEDNQ